MCLAIPGKVVKVKGSTATIDYGEEKREVNNSLLNAKPGEWVLVQQKFVVEKLTEKEAKEALKAWGKIRHEKCEC